MKCPKCNAEVTYEPGDSAGICGGYYCDTCEIGIRDEVPREPVTVDVETMSPREVRRDLLMPPDDVSANGGMPEPTEMVPAAGALHERLGGFTWNNRGRLADPSTVAPRRPKLYLASAILMIAALALSAAGIAINGYFSLSLGASEFAGWLFLAVGVAADLAALVLPSTSAGLWQAGRRATALAGWVVWLLTFIFATTASIGFASSNISEVGIARASRITPALSIAQAMLADAMAARDRECKIVGKVCREREATVIERRLLLDSAMASVEQAADPQTQAATQLVAWISRGSLRPVPNDFAMLRLALLALLPQIGGMLLLIGRRSAGAVPRKVEKAGNVIK